MDGENIFDAIQRENIFLRGVIVISSNKQRFCIGKCCYILGQSGRFVKLGTAIRNEDIGRWIDGFEIELLC